MQRFLQASLALMAFVALDASAGIDADFQSRFGDTFLDAYWQQYPDSAIGVGYYKVANELIVPDAKARAAERRFLEAWLAKLHEFKPDSLNAVNRTDWALLDNELRGDLWQLDQFRGWEWRPSGYNVAGSFAQLLNTEYAPLDQRLRTVLERLDKVPAYYAAAKANVRNPTREHTQLAVEQNRGALEVFGKDLEKQIAASGLSVAERQLFTSRIAATRGAIQGYIDWLEALDAGLAKSGKARSFRVGSALYEQQFAFANPGGGSGAALYRSAQEERQRVFDKMAALADELWPKLMGTAPQPADRFEKIGAVIAKLANDHVAPDQYLTYVRNLIPQLEKWVTDHDLITLDPSKVLVVRDTPAYQGGVAMASVDAPGPYDPGARTYFNVMPVATLPPEQAESFMREYNNWMSPVLIIHEGVPGHYVQLIYANRSPSRIKALFGNGATVEGWAVYSERMMLESGYGGNAPEMWLMYWKWYLRAVTNAVIDYSVQVLGMSEAEVHRILTREAFQSEKEATAKWRRAQLSSVQLTSYYSGFAQIYALRERLKAAQGERFNLKRFHEEFLSYGSAPVPIIEKMLYSSASK
jgi:uncharacterized protein (DUF885 family)